MRSRSACTPKGHREGKIFEQEYKQGKPLYDVRQIGATTDRGTITFCPIQNSRRTGEYKFRYLAHRLREPSY